MENEYVEKELERLKNDSVGKKPEAVERDNAVSGAQLEKDLLKKGPDHHHDLMNIKLNLLEINHRTIEKIEKKRYEIMSRKKGEEAVSEFKEFLFNCLVVK